MMDARVFVEAAQARGFGLWTGVPCSYLQPFINYVINEPSLTYIPASNEGDAIGIAAGYEIGGGLAVVMMQNSGLGNAVNPLTSLAYPHKIPMLLIVTLRGEPQGPADEPQHELMGAITTQMLDLMKIKWAYFPSDAELVPAAFDAAMDVIKTQNLPFCFVMRKGDVTSNEPPVVQASKLNPALSNLSELVPEAVFSLTRTSALKTILSQQNKNDIFLATTGFTGRELYAIEDRVNQLYLVGAMGCASSVGLGLAQARPELRVVILDGDGALLMRMGALATIAYVAPPNLLHIVLDNGLHESTGGQATISRSLHLAAIAKACGYLVSGIARVEQELVTAMQTEQKGPVFLRVFVTPGVPDALPRPKVTPAEVTQRLRLYLSSFE